jgi:hypothetical protein
MTKIEKWRLQELIMVLQDLVESLKRGEQREWHHVFEHFVMEAEQILQKNTVRTEDFKRLVHNILCCFLEGDSFRNMRLFSGESMEEKGMEKRFQNQKARLYHLLTDLQMRFVEYIH